MKKLFIIFLALLHCNSAFGSDSDEKSPSLPTPVMRRNGTGPREILGQNCFQKGRQVYCDYCQTCCEDCCKTCCDLCQIGCLSSILGVSFMHLGLRAQCSDTLITYSSASTHCRDSQDACRILRVTSGSLMILSTVLWVVRNRYFGTKNKITE